MSQDKPPLQGRGRRVDLEETFPPRLLDPVGPGVLTEMSDISGALVAARLLKFAATRGGTRIRPSTLEHIIDQLERAVTEDVRAHCRDEAERVALWLDAPPAPGEELRPRNELEHMRGADVTSRLTVARWAFDNDLDLEMEWFDTESRTWPRGRVEILEIEESGDEVLLHVDTFQGRETISVVDIRLLMPVQRRDDHGSGDQGATVLSFPGFTPQED